MDASRWHNITPPVPKRSGQPQPLYDHPIRWENYSSPSPYNRTPTQRTRFTRSALRNAIPVDVVDVVEEVVVPQKTRQTKPIPIPIVLDVEEPVVVHTTPPPDETKTPAIPLKDRLSTLIQKAKTSEEIFDLVTVLQQALGEAHTKQRLLWEDERFCIICMERPRVVCLDPCGHLRTCKECSDTLRQCPLCNMEIKQRLRVFE